MSDEFSKRSFTATEEQNAVLVLSDGNFWVGQGLGLIGQTVGEICFNVSMTGYQEILTDPSYAGQIITFTFPHIGNVGCNIQDEESNQVFAKGLIVREPISEASNFRSTNSLTRWLKEKKVLGISGVDTRAIANNIRSRGPQVALIRCAELGEKVVVDDLVSFIQGKETLLGQDLASKVSTKKFYTWKEGVFQNGQTSYTVSESGDFHVVVIDYGIKKNILRSLVKSKFRVTVVPCFASFKEIMDHSPDGIFLSNGPGDPFATFAHVRETIEKLLDVNIPIFGICLGNQLLALASGLGTLKLHQGHRGSNHPVKNIKTGQVEITSQNHGFCVSKESIPESVEVTHKSLFDGTIEGIRRKDKWAFAVQYHPESSPGPHDSHYLFKDFYSLIKRSKQEII